MMTDKNYGGWAFSGIAGVFTAVQTAEVMQYISLALTILSVLISFAFTIYKWYLKASEDKKLTIDELKELADEIQHKIEEAQGLLKEGEQNGDKNK